MYYRATIKLNKSQFFNMIQEFVGIVVFNEVKSLEPSKYEGFKILQLPKYFSELIIIIEMFQFYYAWIPLFYPSIVTW